MVGTKDLNAIANNTRLKPCLTTLTIGCAGFYDYTWCSQELSEMLLYLGDRYRDWLLEAYRACIQSQEERLPHLSSELPYLLNVFPSLRSLRLIADDDVSTHLGGWLQPSGIDLLH
jgi:hypothetical protein